MPPLSRHLLAASIISLLGFSSSCLANNYQLYLVRHAEKAATAKDPELSECGKQQAAALATLLKNITLPQIFHTPYQRTTMTATALLQKERLLHSYDPAKLTELAVQLKHNELSAVIVGHSNTTPQLATLLSGQEVAAMAETDYGIVYQLIFAGKQLVTINRLQLPPSVGCEVSHP